MLARAGCPYFLPSPTKRLCLFAECVVSWRPPSGLFLNKYYSRSCAGLRQKDGLASKRAARTRVPPKMKKHFFALLHATGIIRAICWLNRKHVPILCYHSVIDGERHINSDPHKQHIPLRLFLEH